MSIRLRSRQKIEFLLEQISCYLCLDSPTKTKAVAEAEVVEDLVVVAEVEEDQVVVVVEEGLLLQVAEGEDLASAEVEEAEEVLSPVVEGAEDIKRRVNIIFNSQFALATTILSSLFVFIVEFSLPLVPCIITSPQLLPRLSSTPSIAGIYRYIR